MTEWPILTLGEICAEGGGFVRTGPFGSQLHQSDYVDDPDGIPVVMPKDMAVGRVDRSTIARIDKATARRLSQHLLAAGDVALSRRGDVGRSAWIGAEDLPVLCGTGSMRVHPGSPKTVIADYLRYFFRSRLAIDYLEGQAVGATMPNLNSGIVTGMPVPILPLPKQELAGSVLRGLDELIENNRRRVGVLEAMARAIYREWFVHFRYPGHEDVPLVDSPLGLVPDGWLLTTCGETLTALGGGTPSKSEPSFWADGNIPWFTPSDLTRSRTRFSSEPQLSITEAGLARSSARLFPAGSVMMTSRATLGVLTIATTEASTNQGFIVIPPDDRWPPGFIFEWLHDHADELASVATGATFKEITKGAFKRVPFLVAPPGVLASYRAVTEPIDWNIQRLEQQIRCLTAIRDLLLPKLVTGQIDISTLELEAPMETGAA
ncbi:MAG: restriction endonuclease subunit S [Geodermatophilaceae bacterium]